MTTPHIGSTGPTGAYSVGATGANYDTWTPTASWVSYQIEKAVSDLRTDLLKVILHVGLILLLGNAIGAIVVLIAVTS